MNGYAADDYFLITVRPSPLLSHVIMPNLAFLQANDVEPTLLPADEPSGTGKFSRYELIAAQVLRKSRRLLPIQSATIISEQPSSSAGDPSTVSAVTTHALVVNHTLLEFGLMSAAVLVNLRMRPLWLRAGSMIACVGCGYYGAHNGRVGLGGSLFGADTARVLPLTSSRATEQSSLAAMVKYAEKYPRGTIVIDPSVRNPSIIERVFKDKYCWRPITIIEELDRWTNHHRIFYMSV